MANVYTLPSRFSALDGWRGICALLVALYHFPTVSHVGGWGIVQHAYLFVDFFFVLSGFVITYAYWDRIGSWRAAGVMMWRRLGRLWPLHVALLAAFVALELAAPVAAWLLGIHRSAAGVFDPNSSSLLSAVPTNLFLLHGLGVHDRLTWNLPSWSISAEFWTYALFACLLVVTRSRTVIAAGVIALGAWGVVAAFSPRYIGVDYDLGFLRCLAGFFAGHLVYLGVRRRPCAMRLPTLCEALVVAAIGVFVVYAGQTPVELAAPLVFALAVWVFAHEAGGISRVLKGQPFAWLGVISYSIYMVHALIIVLIHRMLAVIEQIWGVALMVRTGSGSTSQLVISLGGPWTTDLVVAVYAGVVVGLGMLTWRYIEMPCQKAWNRRVDGTKRERVVARKARFGSLFRLRTAHAVR
jgi:peptidoglycan/LPS O-acetylase OafA/YrhL